MLVVCSRFYQQQLNFLCFFWVNLFYWLFYVPHLSLDWLVVPSLGGAVKQILSSSIDFKLWNVWNLNNAINEFLLPLIYKRTYVIKHLIYIYHRRLLYIHFYIYIYIHIYIFIYILHDWRRVQYFISLYTSIDISIEINILLWTYLRLYILVSCTTFRYRRLRTNSNGR